MARMQSDRSEPEVGLSDPNVAVEDDEFDEFDIRSDVIDTAGEGHLLDDIIDHEGWESALPDETTQPDHPLDTYEDADTLLLAGASGSGKTAFLLALLHELERTRGLRLDVTQHEAAELRGLVDAMFPEDGSAGRLPPHTATERGIVTWRIEGHRRRPLWVVDIPGGMMGHLLDAEGTLQLSIPTVGGITGIVYLIDVERVRGGPSREAAGPAFATSDATVETSDALGGDARVLRSLLHEIRAAHGTRRVRVPVVLGLTRADRLIAGDLPEGGRLRRVRKSLRRGESAYAYLRDSAPDLLDGLADLSQHWKVTYVSLGREGERTNEFITHEQGEMAGVLSTFDFLRDPPDPWALPTKAFERLHLV